MFPGLFLDRDGVIIQHRINYVRSWEDVNFIPGSLEALARLKSSSYRIVLVTNQSAIGRGLVTLETAYEINRKLMDEIVRAGGRIDGIFLCPHHPDENCPCRKPKPGLILQAAEALQIDLAESILVGDTLTDILAGQAAGINRLVLVKTGLGAQQLSLVSPPSLVTPLRGVTPSLMVFTDLFSALLELIP
jgi:D-glycero-D-manno-heptose 1,7-bisphosphate phosphatase